VPTRKQQKHLRDIVFDSDKKRPGNVRYLYEKTYATSERYLEKKVLVVGVT